MGARATFSRTSTRRASLLHRTAAARRGRAAEAATKAAGAAITASATRFGSVGSSPLQPMLITEYGYPVAGGDAAQLSHDHRDGGGKISAARAVRAFAMGVEKSTSLADRLRAALAAALSRLLDGTLRPRPPSRRWESDGSVLPTPSRPSRRRPSCTGSAASTEPFRHSCFKRATGHSMLRCTRRRQLRPPHAARSPRSPCLALGLPGRRRASTSSPRRPTLARSYRPPASTH